MKRVKAGKGRTVRGESGSRQGEWALFGVTDGLPSALIHSIAQDREGNMWFGTYQGGVCRYDGEEFTTFSIEDGLADDSVQCILEDREGNLWFGTHDKGVSRYDGKRFVTFGAADGLADDSVQCILEDRRGNLWFGTGWWEKDTGGVSQYDGERFTSFTTADGLPHCIISCAFEDREGNLWFSTLAGGVARYDGEGFTVFTEEDGLADNRAWSIAEDEEGNLWIGTRGGVSRYDGEKWTTVMSERGSPHTEVYEVFRDREGYLWMGNAGGGVRRYDGKYIQNFTQKDGLANNWILCSLEDRGGRLWFGTTGGVSRYDGEKFLTFTTADGLPHGYVERVLEDRKGNLWFGTAGGVSRYDGEKFLTFTTADGLPHNQIECLLEDHVGHIWLGTYHGLGRYDGKGFVTFTTADGLPHNRVRCVLEDREGRLWFGTEGGPSRYDGKEFVTFTRADGLAHDHVLCTLEDRQGNLWFGTAGGVSRYDGKRFVSFTRADGLPHNRVRCMLEDQEGHLWFGTFGGGIARYDGAVFQELSRKDGLVDNAVIYLLQDRRGEVWIATQGGVTRYCPYHAPVSVALTDVVAGERHGPVREIRLPVSQRHFAFEFRGASFKTRPEAMVYHYRLQGYEQHEQQWRISRARRVEYHDLSLGEYTFQVCAVDRDLNYSAPATVKLTVEPDPRIEALTEALSGSTGEFIGQSLALRQVLAQLEQVAPTDLTALILGETGTGKGLAARMLHKLSPRSKGPFIQVSCGAIPRELVENELFGHERGAFTSALLRKLGKVELAQGGTLLLDEIGDLVPEAQVKLLRLLEDRTFERVGGTETLTANVRVVAATNRDLAEMMAEEQFREDLYYRLQVFVVRLPPLRQRREDIPMLAAHFMRRMAAHLNKEVSGIAPEALEALMAYDWPGNIRELEHAMQRAVIVCPGPAIRPEDIALEPGPRGTSPVEELSPEEYERRYLVRVLEECGWVVKGPQGAAARLGMPASTLQSRMKKLGIRRS